MDSSKLPLELARFDSDDAQYKCLCGIHVQKAAHMFAVIGIVAGVLGVLFSVTSGQYYNIGASLAGILVSLLVIVGGCTKRPILFLPYII
jgi:hypothetical protein